MSDNRASGAIRTLRPWEKRKLRNHLLRLDPEARRARFGGELKDAAIARFVDSLDRHSSVSVGYFERGTLRGAAQIVRHPRQWFEGAELSIAVERGWRGRGIGAALFDAAVVAARRRGIATLYLAAMPANDAVRALARRHGVSVQTLGALEGVIRLPRRLARRGWRVRLALVRRRLRRFRRPRAAA